MLTQAAGVSQRPVVVKPDLQLVLAVLAVLFTLQVTGRY